MYLYILVISGIYPLPKINWFDSEKYIYFYLVYLIYIVS